MSWSRQKLLRTKDEKAYDESLEQPAQAPTYKDVVIGANAKVEPVAAVVESEDVDMGSEEEMLQWVDPEIRAT